MINTSVRLTCVNGAFTRYFTPPDLTLDAPIANDTIENIVQVTTAGATLPISAMGWAYFQNVTASTSVVVCVGSDEAGTFRGFTRLKPREWGVCRLVEDTTYSVQCEEGVGRLLYGVWGETPTTAVGTTDLSWSLFTVDEWDAMTVDGWDTMTV